MTLIEGIGDDVITLVFILFTIIIIIMSWLSTNVREFPFPANLLVIERRSRRLYTANNINGNLNIINSHNISSNSASNQASNNSNNNMNSNSVITGDTGTSFGSNSRTTSTVRIINTSTRTNVNLNNTNNLEMVNELVEQALVDNLLDGEIFTAHDIGVLNNTETSSGINSGNGQAIRSMGHAFNFNQESTINNNNQSESQDNQENEQIEANCSDSADTINILIKFVNEKEMKIQAKPNDTILLLKKAYFNKELSSNKIVRFIYQGQFLNDTNTVKFYNIKDQTTIHCHITTKPGTSSSSNNQTSNENNNETINQHITTTTTNNNNNTAISTTTTSIINNNNNDNNQTGSNESTVTHSELLNEANQDQGFTTVISIDLNSILLPLCAIILGACWYFRINFKHLFSPLSTLILVIFSFLYAILLFNNLHSTSTNLANSLLINTRLSQASSSQLQARHQQQQQNQSQ